ncbi:4205_t:CDS:1, partial [Cetraspora pellucida]
IQNKKRALEIEDNKEKKVFKVKDNKENHDDVDSLNILKQTNLSDYITYILDFYSMQSEKNKENLSKFYFKCAVNVSILDSIIKKIADDLAESVKDIDSFI